MMCCCPHGSGAHLSAPPRSHGTTELTYSGSPQRCQPGFGNAGTAGVAGAPVAAALGALAAFVAAAGCIPQCFAAAH